MEQDRWYKKGDALAAEIAESRNAPGTAFFWYLGQMGLVAKINNVVCCFDVILNEFKGPDGVSTRVYPPPFPADTVLAADYFFCTHNHIDHLDPGTVFPLAKANPRITFVVPMPHRKALIDGGIDPSRVIGAQDGVELALSGGLSVTAVAAAHAVYEQDAAGDYLCLGFVLSGGGFRVYHAGDTMVTPQLVDALKALGPLDAAMLPINGADWERTSLDVIGNMSPLDAAKLCRAVPVDLAIPGHYDLFAMNSETPAAFAACMYSICPEKRHHTFALGERYCFIKP
jgi:L-ascorbate metabolism protein UlaG (beta-lactamase superfamily)